MIQEILYEVEHTPCGYLNGGFSQFFKSHREIDKVYKFLDAKIIPMRNDVCAKNFLEEVRKVKEFLDSVGLSSASDRDLFKSVYSGHKENWIGGTALSQHGGRGWMSRDIYSTNVSTTLVLLDRYDEEECTLSHSLSALLETPEDLVKELIEFENEKLKRLKA